MIETLILEYSTEALASGRSIPLRTRIQGSPDEISTITAAIAFADTWKLSPSVLEVLSTDGSTYVSHGNLADHKAEHAGFASK
jgi:hypothetical protein